MKYILIVVMACIALSLPAVCQAEEPHGDFIYASGGELMLRGKPFGYFGANCYYLMVYSVQPDMRKFADEVFDAAKKMGLRVIRTWAFNDGKRQWNALQTAPGSYKESTFVALDHVVARAKQEGFYLILSFGNNWDGYGGIRQYVDWSPTTKKKEHDEFFTDENTRQYYKDHITAVLNRENTITGIKYKDDPTILAWEVMNEPQVNDDRSGDTLYAWLREMTAHIKSIDKNHLVITGEEGFYAGLDQYDWKYNGSKGGDFARNTSLDTVDAGSFHLWPSSDAYGLTPEDVEKWISLHAADAKKLGKPLMLTEFGMYRGYNGDTIERDRFYEQIVGLAQKYSLSGINLWFLLHKGYRRYDDGYGIYYPEDESTIRIITSGAAKINK